MEWTVTNTKTGEKHYVSFIGLDIPMDTMNCTTRSLNTTSDKALITIMRVPVNGGRPKRIKMMVDRDITIEETVRRVNKIVELDDELYTLMEEHTEGQ